MLWLGKSSSAYVITNLNAARDVTSFYTYPDTTPTTDKTILTQNMKVPHFHHSATPLPDHRVLIVGGNSPVVEVYNPKLNVFSEMGNLNHSRHLHTAILMPREQVLIIGGKGSTNSSRTIEISPVLVSAKAD